MDKLSVLTVKDVARELHVHEETVKDWLRSGKLPGFKVGRDWRVRRESLDAALAEMERETRRALDKKETGGS